MRSSALRVAFSMVILAAGPSFAQTSQELLERAYALNRDAGAALDGGDVSQAEALARRSLQAFEAAQGPQGAALGNALCTLAEASILRGDYKGGERHLRRAARLAEIGKGPLVLKAAIHGRLGGLDLLRGRYSDAEARLERALELGEEALGQEHPALHHAIQLLGETYRLRNRPDEARMAYERALALLDRQGKALHADALASLSGLALVAERQEQPARAGAFHVRALETAEATLDRSDPGLAIYLARYAAFQDRQGDAAKAEALFTRAVAIVERCGERCEGLRTVVLEGLAAHLAAQGRGRELARVRDALGTMERAQTRLQAPLSPPPGFTAEDSHAPGAWLP